MNKKTQDQFYIKLGLNIINARKRAGMKQEDLAELLTLSRASLVNIEKGRQKPSLHILYDIAMCTKTNLEELFPEVSEVYENGIELSWIRTISSKKVDEERNIGLFKFLNKI